MFTRAHSVPGTETHAKLMSRECIIAVPLLQMRRLRHRDLESLARSLQAMEQGSWRLKREFMFSLLAFIKS